MNLKLNWDAVGIFSTLLCAIHCILLPVLLSSLPLFGINIIHNLIFEWVMIVLAGLIGVYALYHGFIKHHRKYSPLLLFFVGFILLVSKQILHRQMAEFWLLIPAVFFIITAHTINYRLCHKSKCSSTHHIH